MAYRIRKWIFPRGTTIVARKSPVFCRFMYISFATGRRLKNDGFNAGNALFEGEPMVWKSLSWTCLIACLPVFALADDNEGTVLSVRSDIASKGWTCGGKANNALYFIKLKRQSDSEVRWFWVEKGEKEGISVALTAFSISAKVFYEEGAYEGGSCNMYSLGRIYLKDAQ